MCQSRVSPGTLDRAPGEGWGMDGDAEVDDGAEFGPDSPWSRPPIYRPPAQPDQSSRARPTPPTAPPARSPAPPSQSPAPPARSPAAPTPSMAPPAPVGQGSAAARTGPGHPQLDVDVPLSYATPTAEEFATRRAVRPREWAATTGVRGAAQRGTFGLVRLRPNRRERERRVNVAAVRRSFGGLRQVTVVNPKGGAGKTVATLMLGLTFGQTRGGFVLAWDNNETQGTLGMR
ncbi:MAG TPA: chromosome partitioning protein, partial [Micromonosporaceae bacterium]